MRARGSLVGGLLCAGLTLHAQQRPTEVATLPTQAKATSFVLAKTGRIAGAICGDRTLRVWALPDGQVLRTIDLGDRMIDLTAISDSGGAIAAGDHAGGYTVWDTSTGAVLLTLSMPFYPSALTFSPDGARLAIAPVGEPVQIYDIASHSKIVELQRPVGGTAALAFSRDGSRLAAADADTVVRIYDAQSDALLANYADFLLESLAAAFTADGKQLVTGGDKVMATVDVATGALVRKSGKLDDPVGFLDISSNGILVAATLMHADNMLMPGPVIVSERASGRRVMQWLPPTLALGGGWTTDGRLLIATATETALHIWRVQ